MAVDDIGKETQRREKLLTEQFAQTRRRLGGAKRETGRQSRRGFERLQALSGQTGGGIEKARQRSLREVGAKFGEIGAGLSAQEAGAKQALLGEEAAKRFQRAERVGSQEFASGEAGKQREFMASESALARSQQASQFASTLQFQKDSFADQMSFQKMEFTENQKTNIINAATALKDMGIGSKNDWMAMLEPLGFDFGQPHTARDPVDRYGPGGPQNPQRNV